METRIVVALIVVVVAAVVAWAVQRRPSDVPSGGKGPAASPLYGAARALPHQLDRADFDRPDAPWLVVLFSSRTCGSCADVAAKLAPLESDHVAVQEVEWPERRDLHERYGIDAVPLTLVADAEGVVKATFVGKATAADLWAAVAEARRP